MRIKNIFQKKNNNQIICIDEKNQRKIVKKIKGLKIFFNGNNSIVEIHMPNKFHNCTLRVGNNNFVQIKASSQGLLNFITPYTMSDNSELKIGKNFHCVSCDAYMHDEKNNNIYIGDDVLFSFGIILWPSDGHTVYDLETRKVINKSSTGITIGNHVWVGMQSNIMKNVNIPNNTVVGAKSLVNRNFKEEFTAIAGCPAKVIKRNINWTHCSIEDYEKENIIA